MSEKLCVFCEYFTMDGGFGEPNSDGDTYSSPDIHCGKWEWSINYDSGEDEFREKILKANTCKDYKQVGSK